MDHRTITIHVKRRHARTAAWSLFGASAALKLIAQGDAMALRRIWRVACLILVVSGVIIGAYDPLAESVAAQPGIEIDCVDAKRERTIPVLVTLPAGEDPSPVIIFSHGLGGDRHGNRHLVDHWARRGMVVVSLQHPGSDSSLWQGQPPRQARRALLQAASLEQFQHRVADVRAVLDELEIWQENVEHPFAARLDLERIGIAGYSFGALTAQACAGQALLRPGFAPFYDARIHAAVLLSPTAQANGSSPQESFAEVPIPWLLLTGSEDQGVLIPTPVEQRLAIYPALPAGGKYELVLHGANHMGLSDRDLPGQRQRRDPHHHRLLQATSSAFWDAWLGGNDDARAWLEGDGITALLAADDRWQWK